MVSHLSLKDKLKRFLYIGNPEGIYITGNPESHLSYINKCRVLIILWNKAEEKATVQDFLGLIQSVNDDKLLTRRENIFYILATALVLDLFKQEEKQKIRDSVLKFVKSDADFFNFIKYYTALRADDKKPKISTPLRKLILKFYKSKSTMQLYHCMTKQESYHGWTHKDLIKVCHFKPEHISAVPIIKYALFGIKQLPNPDSPDEKRLVELLKKCHELRTTEDVAKAAALISELHASVDRVNSKLNKCEDIWISVVQEITTREVLQNMYKFFKLGFLKPNTDIQTKIIESLNDAGRIKKCDLHPVEVFIYLRNFEKGGKAIDPKLLDYLNNKKDLKIETLKKLTTPIEPKCQAIVQNMNKCLMLSYNNIKPTGKKFLITIDPLEKLDSNCCHNKKISCLEAAYAITRFFLKLEKNVTVAIFNDNHINIVDLNKSYSSQKAIEKIQETKPEYILPSAPLEWAANKRKHFDVFINFTRNDWLDSVPKEVKEKLKVENPAQNLNSYCKKMKAPDTKLVRFFLGSVKNVHSDATKNVLTVAGFSPDVPRVLDAFFKSKFF